MTIQSHSGGMGAWQRALQKPKGIKPVAAQGKPAATTHVVHVDDGATGSHDYDVSLHPAVLGRLDAHGARLDAHDDRIKRLEGAAQAQLGSPEHDGGS